ncbi:uncharacterized protein K452DRAFT_291184 [Aplosporella prunicola CBS 121167]|uniref:Uncharacterized protein n=1 Tax=Aplosporella prunicola CBS 121167 TaxID=1176127 RepID=A0A6A6B5T6_9PEZI|nr:uncharacterized protein K452DRAFT_291184 [Aplosporella prunicola CBS 121167]KAF2138131.1 hypothetical protein K452DRAFT_291184 [Aplosporella prunicola CBS 121167]
MMSDTPFKDLQELEITAKYETLCSLVPCLDRLTKLSISLVRDADCRIINAALRLLSVCKEVQTLEVEEGFYDTDLDNENYKWSTIEGSSLASLVNGCQKLEVLVVTKDNDGPSAFSQEGFTEAIYEEIAMCLNKLVHIHLDLLDLKTDESTVVEETVVTGIFERHCPNLEICLIGH